jgi:aminocarboxymuconate-semialdehyde decarboxylase
MVIAKTKVIDIHAHIIAKKTPLDLAQYQPSTIYRLSIYNPEMRIHDMDKTGVTIQALSVRPRFGYELDSEIALDISRAQNEMIAKFVSKHPDRFVGLATVPLQDPQAAADELDRAMSTLDMTGVEIGSNVNGKNLDAPELWPFYEKAQELEAFIFVHPTNVAGIERMQKYHLGNLIGNPLDTSLAIASLIFGGVLESFPRLKFCFAHAGGFAPYQRGRLEHGFKVRPEGKEVISKPPSEYFKLLYFDTITHYPPALRYLIESVGSDHVLLGSDYPFDMADPDPVSTVNGLESISSTEKRNVLGENAAKLLRIN